MQKIKRIKERIQKKPYQFFSVLTLLIVAIGVGSFMAIKNSQVKGYSGTPYTTNKSWIMRNITKNGQADTIENHFLTDALSENLNGIDNLSIPYRYASGKVSELNYSISGQYSFIPKWIDGKSKVYLYDTSDLTTPSKVLNDGTLPSSDDSVQILLSTDTNKFLKFTNMGMYNGKIIDIIVRPISVSPNSSIAIGYGKDGNKSGTDGSSENGAVMPGSYLTMGSTSVKVNDSGALINSGTDANYSELDMEFYESISYDNSDEVNITNQKKINVQGLFTYGDFDYNESVGLRSSQIERIYSLKPDARDGEEIDGEGPYLDSDQNLFLDYFIKTQNIYTPTADPTYSGNTLLYNMDVTKYYPKPETMLSYTDAQTNNDWTTMYYLLQRFGTFNNAYTQLTYTYGDDSLVADENKTAEKDYLYFNRASSTNTEPSIRGNWLSFTYKETDALHFSVSASNSGRNTTPANNSSVDTMLANQYIDPDSVDSYLIKEILGNLGYFESSNPPVIPFWAGVAPANNSKNPTVYYYPNSNPNTKGTSIGFISKGLVPVLVPDPVKEAIVENNAGAINWTITQNIPAKFSTSGTRKLILSDTLPEYLELDGAVTVEDLSGNASTYWNAPIITTNADGTTSFSVEATSEALEDEAFYVSSYIVKYKTKFSDELATDKVKQAEFMTNYYKDSYKIEGLNGQGDKTVSNSLVFLNQARLDLENMDIASRTTYSVPEYKTDIDWSPYTDPTNPLPIPDKYKTAAVVPFNPSITINKTGETLSGTDIALPGAEFKVYTKEAGVDVYLKDAAGADLIVTTNAEGKVVISEYYEGTEKQTLKPTTYYLKEVKAPDSYDANATDAEVLIDYIGNFDVPIRNELSRAEGGLVIEKKVYNDSGEEIPNEEVKRGDNLTYIITVKNSTQTASRNTDIQMIDSFDTERVDVVLDSMEKSAVGSISTPGTDTYSPIDSTAYDTASGKMTVDGGTLEQDQYIRFRVKVNVKMNAKSGDLLNTAEATSGTKKESTTVKNILIDETKKIHIKQVVRNTNLPAIIPTEGYVSVENSPSTSPKGSNTKITAIVPSGQETSTIKSRALIVPYSNLNNSYYFDATVPQMYSLVGYTVSNSEAGANSDNPFSIDQIFTITNDEPIYITIYLDALPLIKVPFYNWSDVQNQFGKFK